MSDPAAEPVSDLAALLRAAGAADLEELADEMQNYTEWDVYLDAGDDVHGLRYRIHIFAETLAYPFSLQGLWDEFVELDAMVTEMMSWETLAEQIEEIEGFRVAITCSPTGSWSDLPLHPAYPYKRAAPAAITVAAWRDKRFKRHYPEYDIELRRPDRARVAGQTRLATLRRLWATEWRVDVMAT